MNNETIVITGETNVRNARILALRAAMKLECVGMLRHAGQRSAYVIIKEEFGFKGSKLKVLSQLTDYIDANILTGGTER